MNTYVGSTDKQGAGSQDSRFSMGEGKERNLAMFRVNAKAYINQIYQEGVGLVDVNLDDRVYKSYFSFFANPELEDKEDIFDKYTYLLLLYKEGYGGHEAGLLDPNVFDFKALYTDVLTSYVLLPATPDTSPERSFSRLKGRLRKLQLTSHQKDFTYIQKKF